MSQKCYPNYSSGLSYSAQRRQVKRSVDAVMNQIISGHEQQTGFTANNENTATDLRELYDEHEADVVLGLDVDDVNSTPDDDEFVIV